ncbi:hypothetical protein QYF36_013550 [Acer negundo]|nr:hypothetical protein QYF36_013550 [Acer negundo]
MEFPATDEAATSFLTPVRVQTRIRKRLAKKYKTPSTVEEIEAKLRHADRRRQVIAGCGDRISFWDDRWRGDFSLKQSFPIIFALASKKSCIINEFGSWIGNDWVWNVGLTRRVFDWELVRKSLGNTTIINIPRATNSIADSLAKKGCFIDGDMVDWEELFGGL